MTRLATPTVMKMAQRGTVVDPLSTSHPFSPGESILCQHMIAIVVYKQNYCSLSARNIQLFY